MRILLINDYHSQSRPGGAEVVVETLCQKLGELGNDVCLLTTGPTCLEQIIGAYRHLQVTPEASALRSPYKKNYLGKISNILRQEAPELVHFHNIHSEFGFEAIKTVRDYGSAIVFTAHDAMSICGGKINDYSKIDLPRKQNVFMSGLRSIRRILKSPREMHWRRSREYLRLCDERLAVSQALATALSVNARIRFKVLRNGIDDPLEKAVIKNRDIRKEYGVHGKKLLLLAGRISASKGLGAALKALEYALQKNRDVMLLLIFSKKIKADLDDWIPRQLRDHVITLGPLNKIEMAVVYSEVDIVLTPSLYLDPFPTVNLEAMAHGLPVVSTIFGGSKEAVLDKITGYVVDPRKDEEFGEKLVELISEPKKAIQMGELGRERYDSNFTSRAFAERNLLAYREVLLSRDYR